VHGSLGVVLLLLCSCKPLFAQVPVQQLRSEGRMAAAAVAQLRCLCSAELICAGALLLGCRAGQHRRTQRSCCSRMTGEGLRWVGWGLG
jgi:hypothetical protein